jgi:hypothetical protein
MVGILRPAVFCMILAFALESVPPSKAQRVSDPAPAPIPAQIVTAKKVFISNLGEESEYYRQKAATSAAGAVGFTTCFMRR